MARIVHSFIINVVGFLLTLSIVWNPPAVGEARIHLEMNCFVDWLRLLAMPIANQQQNGGKSVPQTD